LHLGHVVSWACTADPHRAQNIHTSVAFPALTLASPGVTKDM